MVLLIFMTHLHSGIDEDSVLLVVSPQPVLECYMVDDAFKT